MKHVFFGSPTAVEGTIRTKLHEELTFRQLSWWGRAVRLVLLVPVVLLLLLAALTISREAGGVHAVYTPVMLAAVVVLAVAVRALCGEHRGWLWVLFTGAVAVRVVFALGWTVYPHGVYLTNWNLALELAGSEIAKWPSLVAAAGYDGGLVLELPHVIYENLMIRLFGPSLLSIQLPGALWGGLGCVLTACIGKRIGGSHKAGLIAGAIMALCPTLLFSAGMLSWQPMYTLLLLAGMWLLLCRPMGSPVCNAVFAGLAWGFAQVLRPGLPVLLLAGLLWILLALLQKDNRKAMLAQCGCLLGGFLAGLLIVGLAENAMTGANVLNGLLPERMAVGMNELTIGQLSEDDMALMDGEVSVPETAAQRWQGPVGTLKLMLRKVRLQFASYDYEWARMDRGVGLRNRIIDQVMHPALQGYMLAVLLLALGGAVAAVRKQTRAGLLPVVVVLGYLAAAVLLEVDPVYNASIIPMLAVLAAAPALKFAEWTVLVLAPENGKKKAPLPPGLKVARTLVSVVLYVFMLLMVLVFFTGNGAFIYEAF